MSGHRRHPVLERTGDRLVLACPHLVDVVQAPPGIDHRNTIPLARLFAIDPAGQSGLGTVTDLAARRAWPLTPGGLLLLPPERAYRFAFSPGLRLAACHFRLESAPGCDVFAQRQAAWRDDRPDLAGALGAALHDGDDLGAATRCRGLLLQAIGLFLAAEPPAPGCFAPVLDEVERRCRADLAVSSLAALAGLGREHFARSFRRRLGISPREHLHRRLTQRACLRLLAGVRVKTVADELGFSSEFVFSRFFKRRTGSPPRDFRLLPA